MKAIIVLILCQLFIVGCTKKKSTTTESEQGATAAVPAAVSVSSMVISLPTSIAGTQASSLRDADSNVIGIYDGIRRILSTVNTFSDLITSIGDMLLGPDNEIGVDFSTITEGNPFTLTGISEGDATSPSALKIVKNASTAAYDYTITLYWTNEDNKYVPGIIFSLTAVDEENGKGEIFLNIAVAAGSDENSPTEGIVHIVFDTNDATLGKVMSVEMADMSNPSDLGAPSNVRTVISSKDHVMTVYGNFYLPQFGGSQENPIISGAQNYIFTGQVDEVTEKAMMNLAIVPSTNTSTDTSVIFGTYSLGDIFQKGMIENLLGMYDSAITCCCTIGTYIGLSDGNICTNSVAQTGCTCSAKTQSLSDVVSGLDSYCIANPTNQICTSVYYVFKLTNPAYFASTGFVGTADYNTPTSGYDNLSTSGISIDSAKDISELTISMNTTPVTSL